MATTSTMTFAVVLAIYSNECSIGGTKKHAHDKIDNVYLARSMMNKPHECYSQTHASVSCHCTAFTDFSTSNQVIVLLVA